MGHATPLVCVAQRPGRWSSGPMLPPVTRTGCIRCVQRPIPPSTQNNHVKWSRTAPTATSRRHECVQTVGSSGLPLVPKENTGCWAPVRLDLNRTPDDPQLLSVTQPAPVDPRRLTANRRRLTVILPKTFGLSLSSRPK